MPEELNRIVTDRISNYLFCPTQTSVDNLNNEGIVQNVYNVGDVMYDATLYYREKAKQDIQLTQWGIKDNNYVLCTIHRAENTDYIHRLEAIFEALREISLETPVILPIHPRTRKLLKKIGKENWLSGITILDPLPYLEMLRLESTAKVILTDSGGIQKEAFFHQVPCVTLRDETEWVETVSHGWNKIVGYRRDNIMKAYNEIGDIIGLQDIKPYGSGEASNKIVEIISKIN
jgi:UDP-GlcNAc3NAcA epimerase